MSADFDFTSVCIPNADGPWLPLDNTPWAHQDDVKVRAYFGELATPLTEHICNSTFVVGCCAWLTHPDIIQQLSQLDFGCQIVCQKEDFLRPDSRYRRGWKSKLHSMYSLLSCRINRHDCAARCGMPQLSVCMDDGYMNAVRCVGNHNSDRHPAFPRMHHKFLVFCDISKEQSKEGWEDGYYELSPIPRSVWTGSFNPTFNGTKSRENAVVIESEAIASAYFKEWYQMLALSEPLDWESNWSAPEYRIGT